MIYIPGEIISLLTFIGVIVHEIAHKFFCDILNIPVYKVCYWRFGNPSGYVIHAPVNRLRDALLIAIGPLILNTLLCAVLTFPVMFPMSILSTEHDNIIFLILMWAGISIGAHAFPSNQDIVEFLELVNQSNKKGMLYVCAKIFSGVLKTVNFLRVIWIDFIYAFAIGMILPLAVMHL